MACIFDLVSTFGLWGSLALLAWGAAICLEQAFRTAPAGATRRRMQWTAVNTRSNDSPETYGA